MNPARLRNLLRFLRSRWVCCASLPALALGCVQTEPWTLETPGKPQVRAVAPDAKPSLPVVRTRGKVAGARQTLSAEQLPEPARVTAGHHADDISAEIKVLPITLDTVLRLAEEQNGQIALARERLFESQAEKSLADLAWLPDIRVGMAYYRHEGGIQNENGLLTRSSTGALFPGMDMTARLDLRDTMFQRINAERKIWQQQGELARVTSETLLEAANTYTDLLSARASEAALVKLQAQEAELLKKVDDLAKTEPASRVLAETLRAQAAGHEQIREKLHQQGEAAAAKLAYLLGLGPNVQLVPGDELLAPVHLVDPALPVQELVARAVTAGPGVRELENLLGVIQSGMDRASGSARLLPVIEMRMLEGAFGAGPGASTTWDNRWDLGLQMRWSITELFTARKQQMVAQSRLSQVGLSYQDLRAKLVAGVQEAQSAITSGEKQMDQARLQVKHTAEAYRLSKLRVEERAPGSSHSEVMAAIRAEELARLNSINIIRAYNKAQIRLLVLTGTPGHPHPHHGAACSHPQ